MGNSSKKVKCNQEIDVNLLKWTNKNTKIVRIHDQLGKVYSCACRKAIDDDNSILIASASQDGHIVLSKMNITVNRNNKIKINCNKKAAIQLRSAWVMHCSISPSIITPKTYVLSSGGLDNLVSIYTYNDKTGNTSITTELQHHQGYVSWTKFLNDKYIVSCSGDASVVVTDIDNGSIIATLNDANGDVVCLDYIYMHNKHVIVYGSIDACLYIRDITDEINKYEKTNNNDEKHESKQHNDDGVLYMIESKKFATDIAGFETDINCVRFSSNGDYIAACSDDSSYNIYYRTDRYDSWWNMIVIEWRFLCKKKLFEIDGSFNPGTATCCVWADDHTVMTGCDESNKLFVTQIIEQKSSDVFIDAVTNGVEYIITNLPFMNWIGATKYISYIILLYFCDTVIVDYVISPINDDNVRTSCLDSCKWGKDNQNEMVIMGSWDRNTYGIVYCPPKENKKK